MTRTTQNRLPDLTRFQLLNKVDEIEAIERRKEQNQGLGDFA